MENLQKITDQELQQAREILVKMRDYYYGKMVGQASLGTSLFATIMCNGHILLESVPGLAKTTAAKTVTEAVNVLFREFSVHQICFLAIS